MYLIWMLIVGAIAGGIAKLIMPGKDPGGCLVTIALGIAGSFIGGFLGRMLGVGRGGEGRLTAGIIGSIIGALILLAIYRWWVGRKGTPAP